jgi:FtsP/CotA-like multicopper oxidase with cupredoxin domain
MRIDRREFLKFSGAAVLAGGASTVGCGGKNAAATKPDYTVWIGQGLADLAPDRVVSTRLYNGQFPGPLLRFTQGRQAVVDIFNDTDNPERLHWHGQTIPVDAQRRGVRRRRQTAGVRRCARDALSVEVPQCHR